MSRLSHLSKIFLPVSKGFLETASRNDPLTWAIVADDLTGACDSGAQFGEFGFFCQVCLESLFTNQGAVDVLAFTTDSRHVLPEEAYRKVRETTQAILRDTRRRIYKKIDSTLRGNPGLEIQAAMEACRAPFALVAPAYPEMGRTICQGRLYLDGVSTGINVPELLLDQGVKHVVSLPRPRFVELPEITVEPGSVIVADTFSREDLVTLAAIALELRPAPLLAGSAGLARETAAFEARRSGHSRLAHTELLPSSSGSVILCIGSTNPATIQQMQFIAKTLPVTVASPDEDTARKAIEDGHHLMWPVTRVPEPLQVQKLAFFLKRPSVRGLVLSGGDTATQVCRAVSAQAIRLQGEVIPGVAWGRLVGGEGDGVPVVTKAGGFGKTDALLCVVDFLTRLPQRVQND